VVAADSLSGRVVCLCIRSLSTMTERKPIAIDLFSGVGGLSEGLKQAGYRVAGAVELDAAACQIYRLNHPKARLWNIDIRKLSAQSVMKALGLRPGQVELLAACPPCQGFSAMRTRNGAMRNRDGRNDLIFDVLRFATRLRPKSLMMENVPGLAKNRRFRLFRRGLAAMGYEVNWRVLNAVDFGVPQRRKRLVLLAARGTAPQFAAPVAKRRTVRDAIGRLKAPGRSRDPLHNYAVKRQPKVLARIREIPRNGGSRTARGRSAQLNCHREHDGFYDVYGRMAWEAPSPTITGGCINPSKGRFLHPTAHRAITLREAALLQTFPQRYRFPIEHGRYHIALMIGNALPPEFIRRHALALRNSFTAAQ
jgi:DNA (cytosine-5)-methyltransferase 1